MKPIKYFLKNANRSLRKILAGICAAVFSALTLIVLWGVVTRYLLGQQAVFTDELARMLLIILTFFGGALAFADGAHIGLSFLADKFAPSARAAAGLAAIGLSLIFSILIMTLGGAMLVCSSVQSGNELASAPISLWQIYLCVPASGIFASMFLLEAFFDALSGGKKEGL